eukprot:403337467
MFSTQHNTNSTSNQEKSIRKIYQPQRAINFKNNKYLVYEADWAEYRSPNLNRAVVGSMALTGYKVVKAIQAAAYFKTILWATPFIIAGLYLKSNHDFDRSLVSKIYLLENGEEAEFVLLSGSVVKIKLNQLKDWTENEESLKEFLQTYEGIITDNVVPIILPNREDHYLLEKESKIEDKELFKAVVNGYTIDVRGGKQGDQPNIIDI